MLEMATKLLLGLLVRRGQETASLPLARMFLKYIQPVQSEERRHSWGWAGEEVLREASEGCSGVASSVPTSVLISRTRVLWGCFSHTGAWA